MEDKGHFAEKHASTSKADPKVMSILKERAVNGGLPCAVAFDIAKTLQVAPGLVGKNADLLELKLKKCQLGLFGYEPNKRIVKPAETVSEDLKALIEEGLVDGRLPCLKAWEIAEKMGLKKMAVSSACEKLAIKIKPCQLGAF